MKKILFDLTSLNSFGKTQYHGGGEYSKEFLLELQKYKQSSEMYYLFDGEYEYIDDQVRDKIPEKRVLYIEKIYEIPDILRGGGFDAFISGLPYKYRRLNFGTIECFFTIHGLRRIELPYDSTEFRYSDKIKNRLMFFFRKYLTENYVRIKKKHISDLLKSSVNTNIIVVSEHTKFSILSNFKDIQENQLSVSYSFLARRRIEQIDSEVCSIGKFYLMVSTHRWVKNAYRAAKAFDKLFSQGRLNTKVVLLGMNEKIFSKFGIKNKSHFILKGYVSRNQYESFMKAAYALVYPSLNEGFGYPPYEAMKYGTPVAMGAASSLNEIYDNRNSLFFNPYDINEIALRILELEYWDLMKTETDSIIREAEELEIKQQIMSDKLMARIFS